MNSENKRKRASWIQFQKSLKLIKSYNIKLKWEYTTVHTEIGNLEIIEMGEIEKNGDWIKREREREINLDSGIATAVEDLPSLDAFDGGHGHCLYLRWLETRVIRKKPVELESVFLNTEQSTNENGVGVYL